MFHLLYVDYDTAKDFMPQFEAAVEKLNILSKTLRKMDHFAKSEGLLAEGIVPGVDAAVMTEGSSQGGEK